MPVIDSEIWGGVDPIANTPVGLEKTFELLCARRGDRGVGFGSDAMVYRDVARMLMLAERELQSLLCSIQGQCGSGPEIDAAEAELISIITMLESLQRKFS